MLETRHFLIFTDHKPLTYTYGQMRDNCSPRQFNHLDFISQFMTDIGHISEEENVVVDALSRVHPVCMPDSPATLDEAQETDAELATILQWDTALCLEKIQVPGLDVTALRHNSKTTLYTPANLRRQVFEPVYSLGDLGTRATAKFISQRFVWPRVQDCRTSARACQSCQRSKISRHNTKPMGDFIVPTSRYQHVYIDIVGPLPTSDGLSRSIRTLAGSHST
jgi:hypothetical protein